MTNLTFDAAGYVWCEDGDSYAIAHGNAAHLETAEERARLIAAAPDLLRVCEKLAYYEKAILAKEFEPSSESLLSLFMRNDTAIAKATGVAS